MIPPLRVLSWAGRWGRALAETVSQPFTEATGLPVEAVRHIGLRLPSALTSRADAGQRPPVDVVWCNTSAAIRAARADCCDPLDDLAGLAELVRRAAPPDGRGWPFVQAYVVHYVLVYRRALFPTAPPRSWQVLLDRAHERRVVLYPGGKGFLPIAQLLGGGTLSGIPDAMAPCWSALRALGGQLGRPDYSIGLGPLFSRGEIDLCYRALPNALGFVDEGVDVGWVAPDEGVADTTDALWVPRGLDEATRDRARKYVAFAMTKPVQERWCEALAAIPMHRSAAAPALLRARGLSTDPEDLASVLHIDPETEAEHEDAWAVAFDEAVGQAPR
jgi:putative spermidine/putrescine transport system substrate-binding protein